MALLQHIIAFGSSGGASQGELSEVLKLWPQVEPVITNLICENSLALENTHAPSNGGNKVNPPSILA